MHEKSKTKVKQQQLALGCAKSIALLTKVINLSLSVHPGSQRAILLFFFSLFTEFTREKRTESRACGSASSRALDADGLVNVLVFLSFSSLFFFLSLAVQRERNDGPARSMDGG